MSDRPITLRELIHAATEDWALLDEPVYFDYIADSELVSCVVTGLTVREWHGVETQSLQYTTLDESPRATARKAQSRKARADA